MRTAICEEFFNTPERRTGTHKTSLISYKQISGEMVIMNDFEWTLLYIMIYYEKFRKIMQWTEKEALRVDILSSQTG